MPWSLYFCLFAPHIWVLFFVHMLFVVNHTFNATLMERLQQHPLLFTTNRTDHTFFLWRLRLAWPSHPGYSTILLWLESQVASVQIFTLWQQATTEIICHDHSITGCSRHIYMGVIFFTHIPFLVNHTFYAMPMERLQQQHFYYNWLVLQDVWMFDGTNKIGMWVIFCQSLRKIPYAGLEIIKS